MSEKTELPTEHKLREARKNGQLPRSRLFTSAGTTLGALIGLLGSSEASTEQLHVLSRRLFSLGVTDWREATRASLEVLVRMSAPVLAGATLGALLTATTVAGLQMNVSTLAPRWERTDPVAGFQKLFSARQVVDVFKGLLVAIAMFSLVWSAVKAAAPLALASTQHAGTQVFALLLPAVLKGACLLMLLGFADYAHARHRHVKDLMMSREDIKQEHKNAEGDPRAKHERKALAKKLAQSGPARGVAQATAIVVNPTHIAVALRYVEGESEVPYLVAKGRDEDAMSIRRAAQSLKIPIVKDIPLARSLIHYDVGEDVPEELYQAAAAVLKVALVQSESRPVSSMKSKEKKP